MARILVVDDDAEVRLLLRHSLERNGYEVEGAANGNEAVTVFNNNPADLIITDIIMPGKEGIELIMEFRRDHPGIKIIAISGGGRNNPENYLRIAKQLGAAFTFSKPFDRKELVESVNKLLNN